MNLRQAQRSLSELIAKCEAAHVELPENPFEARAEAVESIIHSLKDGRPNLNDAQEKLQQKFGIQVQHLGNEEERKRLRRHQSNQKNVSIHEKEDVKLTQGADGESAQCRSSRTATVTRLKQQASREESSPQETAAIKVSKKTECSRDVIVREASDDTEEKLPLAPSENVAMDNHGKSILSGSPDQEMIDLLEDLTGR
ncbi:unnamed protein product [Peronospora destructor]|uniref:Uncharacterized protein n=1 Tax=Peronospora destructor TaxID=86335 RepID=A0AAV0VC28_9STRA|nr:unnamed protein product [Peronospora destructor]